MTAPPGRADAALNFTLTALAHPARRAILQHLAQGPARVSALAAPFAMSLNAVSKHILVLERARLVRRRRDGREHILTFHPDPLDSATHWISTQRAVWNDRLDRLAALLETAERPAPGGSAPARTRATKGSPR